MSTDKAQKQQRTGRLQLIEAADWVEVSLCPHGQRAAIPRWSVEGVLEREDGGATLVYRVGNVVTNVPLLDLYLPMIRKVLTQPDDPNKQSVGVDPWDIPWHEMAIPLSKEGGDEAPPYDGDDGPLHKYSDEHGAMVEVEGNPS